MHKNEFARRGIGCTVHVVMDMNSLPKPEAMSPDCLVQHVRQLIETRWPGGEQVVPRAEHLQSAKNLNLERKSWFAQMLDAEQEILAFLQSNVENLSAFAQQPGLSSRNFVLVVVTADTDVLKQVLDFFDEHHSVGQTAGEVPLANSEGPATTAEPAARSLENNKEAKTHESEPSADHAGQQDSSCGSAKPFLPSSLRLSRSALYSAVLFISRAGISMFADPTNLPAIVERLDWESDVLTPLLQARKAALIKKLTEEYHLDWSIVSVQITQFLQAYEEEALVPCWGKLRKTLARLNDHVSVDKWNNLLGELERHFVLAKKPLAHYGYVVWLISSTNFTPPHFVDPYQVNVDRLFQKTELAAIRSFVLEHGRDLEARTDAIDRAFRRWAEFIRKEGPSYLRRRKLGKLAGRAQPYIRACR
jgi:hypothetical protein